MDITGKIIAALEPRSGVAKSSGNPWKVQEYVIETQAQYPRKCAFEVFGEDRIKQFNIQVGQELTVSFDIDARENNGRWFNTIRAWRVVPAQTGDNTQTPPVTLAENTPKYTPTSDAPVDTDDLPF